jgi:hypothetical protein
VKIDQTGHDQAAIDIVHGGGRWNRATFPHFIDDTIAYDHRSILQQANTVKYRPTENTSFCRHDQN